MEVNIQMNISQVQKLILSPQLEQSFKILKMDSDELGNLVEAELLNNPILEISDTYYSQGLNKYALNNSTDYINSIPDAHSVGDDLIEVLLLQLQTYNGGLSKEELLLGEYIINCIDDRGYLNYRPNELAEILQKPQYEILKILGIIQSFEPLGVGACNLKECLLLQAEEKDVQLIISEYLDEVAKNNIPFIAQELGLSVQRTIECISLIKKMNPIPGRGYGRSQFNLYIQPDVMVFDTDQILNIEFLKRKASFVQVSPTYLEWIKSVNKENQDNNYRNSLLKEAGYFVRAIQQRDETMNKVVAAIVNKQRNFFYKGKLYLVNMTMKEIADEIEMHESTVSRAVCGKYLQCKWGTFELKYFFSNKFQKNSHIDAESICPQQMVKKIIEDEDSKKPLSDESISKELSKLGLIISRRTVTKYREQLNITSSRMRKKW